MQIHELKRFLTVPGWVAIVDLRISRTGENKWFLGMYWTQKIDGCIIDHREYLETARGELRYFAKLDTLVSIFLDAGIQPKFTFTQTS